MLRPVTVHTYGLFLDVVRCYAMFCYTYTSLSDPVQVRLQELIYFLCYAYSSSFCEVVTVKLHWARHEYYVLFYEAATITSSAYTCYVLFWEVLPIRRVVLYHTGYVFNVNCYCNALTQNS